MSVAPAPWGETLEARYPDPDLLRLPGIEQLRAFIDGRAPSPPIYYLTGMRPTEVGLGTSTFSMPATRWLLSPQGVVTVGTLAILADGPLGCAIQSALPPMTAYVTSELSMRQLRPAPKDGTLIARGSLVHAGRSLGLSRVQITDDQGRLLADGSSLLLIRPLDESVVPDGPSRGEPGPEPDRIFERSPLGEVIDQEVWNQMTGLEVLQAQIKGDVPAPPIHYLTGATPAEAESGSVAFTMPCHEWLCSPLGTVEGGTIAMLADDALSAAIETNVPPGAAMATIDLKVNFLRPVLPDGRELLARGRVRHAGRSIAVAEAEVINADEKTVALATGSAMILPDRPAALADPDPGTSSE
jgi:uncharacterized protein (TIGR00369 family)